MPTAEEIYQTYLKGPAALIRLFEQAPDMDVYVQNWFTREFDGAKLDP
jgi:hypothetical protein